MGSQFPPQGGDDVGAANIAEAMRLWEQYQREQATRPADPATAQGGAQSLFERGFQAAGEPLGNVVGGAMHVLSAPARALNAYAQNQAGTARPVNPLDAAIYGRDMDTGAAPTSYGDLLAGTLSDAGEITPGGKAEKIIKFAGNLITDPAAAPLLLSGAEAAGALAGRMGPGAAPAGPRGPRIPSGKMYPQYGDMPQAPFDPGATQRVPIRPPKPSRVSPFPRAGIEGKVVKGTRPGGPEGPPSPMANQTQAVKTIKPQGKSIESKFAAKKAEMRAGHGETGIESKMGKTRAPREATYRKSPERAGTGAEPSPARIKGSENVPQSEVDEILKRFKNLTDSQRKTIREAVEKPKSGEKTRRYKDRREVADKYPERPYPKGKTGHKVDVPEHLKPKPKPLPHSKATNNPAIDSAVKRAGERWGEVEDQTGIQLPWEKTVWKKKPKKGR